MDKTNAVQFSDSEIIDRLGGTAEVARLCNVRGPSVSEWRRAGIPQARRQFLELLCPAAFDRRKPNFSRQRAAANEGDAAPTDGTPISLKKVA